MRNSKCLESTEQSCSKIIFYQKTFIRSKRLSFDFLKSFSRKSNNENIVQNYLQFKKKESVNMSKNAEGNK